MVDGIELGSNLADYGFLLTRIKRKATASVLKQK